MLSYDALGNLVKAIGWKPNWQAFYEACDKDIPIYPVLDLLRDLSGEYEVQIWSGRCESVEDKTKKCTRPTRR